MLYRKYGRDTPRKLLNLSWQQLVNYLGEGHYRRYDESTATRLLEVCRHLQEDYGGSFLKLRNASADRADFERRLQTLKGVGPKTCEIFMREAAALYDESRAGPFFYEIIQRAGDQGFGFGNFRALFESIERAQRAEKTKGGESK